MTQPFEPKNPALRLAGEARGTNQGEHRVRIAVLT